MDKLIVVKGGGDIATGIAHRLFRSGFKVLVTELCQPTVVRRTVAFAEAVYNGETVVEGVRAVRTEPAAVAEAIRSGVVPVVVDPGGEYLGRLDCLAVVDAILAKKNTGTRREDAAIVIGVGPGFAAPADVHAVVETMRGHDLGRVIYEGSAAANTGIPGEVGGYTTERVLRAAAAGVFVGRKTIGDYVEAGEVVGVVDGKPVLATIPGILRGLLHDWLHVTAGFKLGDIDPRCQQSHCYTISDKARSVGGGVLEAILALSATRRNKSG
ncbi:MAG TPA: selenium-dependent molybdenum cofactor biosynthesis protein YqeB, partial [Negativicutes bacterium]|nr:selenium-dependent molybdenum cofactor biosynthesis protein YqeB [Negativicutes bacterium]